MEREGGAQGGLVGSSRHLQRGAIPPPLYKGLPGRGPGSLGTVGAQSPRDQRQFSRKLPLSV